MPVFSLIDVKSIQSAVPRSHFSESEIECLAQAILDNGGLLRPLILKASDPETYAVVEGHLEYYGAVRAREKSPQKGEMVNAFLIKPKEEAIALQQLKALKSAEPQPSSQGTPATPSSSESSSSAMEIRFANLESRCDRQYGELKAEQGQLAQQITTELTAVKGQIPQRTKPLELFNSLNRASELVMRLKTAGVPEKTAIALVNAIQQETQKKPFESLSDVVNRIKVTKVKGLNEKKMLAIVDSCAQMLFV